MKKKNQAPVRAASATGKAKRGRPALKVNRARHVFAGKRSAARSAVSGTETHSAGTSASTVPGRLGKSRAARNLKQRTAGPKKGVTRGRPKTGIQSTVSDSSGQADTDEFSRHQKVSRALKKLHIDFIKSKSNEGNALGDVSTELSGTKTWPRRSASSSRLENVSEPAECSKGTSSKQTSAGASSERKKQSLIPAETRAKRISLKMNRNQYSLRMKRMLLRSKPAPKTESNEEILLDVTESPKIELSTVNISKQKNNTKLSKSLDRSCKPVDVEENNTFSDKSRRSKSVSAAPISNTLDKASSEESALTGKDALRSRSTPRDINVAKTLSRNRRSSLSPVAVTGRRKVSSRSVRGTLGYVRTAASGTGVQQEDKAAIGKAPKGRRSLSAKKGQGRKTLASETGKISNSREQNNYTKENVHDLPDINPNDLVEEDMELHSKTESIADAVCNMMEHSDSESVRNYVETVRKGVKTVEVLKNSSQTKERSTSLESLVHDGISGVHPVKTIAHSRCSSPGGTEARRKNSDVFMPKTDLARSSSLDNLLYKSDSVSDRKQALADSSSGRRNSSRAIVAGENMMMTKLKPGIQSASRSMNRSVERIKSENARGVLKRKCIPGGSSRESQDGVSDVKKRRLLKRLQDSSTHLMPDILGSSRASRTTAFGGSPAVSRESSPGTLPAVKGKKLLQIKKSETDIKDASQMLTEEQVNVSQNEPPDSKQISVDKCGLSTVKERHLKKEDHISDRDVIMFEETGINDGEEKLNEKPAEKLNEKPEEKLNEKSSEKIGNVAALDLPVKRPRGRPKGSINKKIHLFNPVKRLRRQCSKEFTPFTNKTGKRGRPKKNLSALQDGGLFGYSVTMNRMSADSTERKLNQSSLETKGHSNNDSIQAESSGITKPLDDHPLGEETSSFGEEPDKASLADFKTSEVSGNVTPLDETFQNTLITHKASLEEVNEDCSSDVATDCFKQPPDFGTAKLCQSRKFSQTVRDEKQKVVPTLAQRKNRRRKMRKSRWSTGRLSKQSWAALNSSVRLKSMRVVPTLDEQQSERLSTASSQDTVDESNLLQSESSAVDEAEMDTKVLTESPADFSSQPVSKSANSIEPTSESHLSSVNPTVSVHGVNMPDNAISNSEKLSNDNDDITSEQPADTEEALVSNEQPSTTSQTVIDSEPADVSPILPDDMEKLVVCSEQPGAVSITNVLSSEPDDIVPVLPTDTEKVPVSYEQSSSVSMTNAPSTEPAENVPVLPNTEKVLVSDEQSSSVSVTNVPIVNEAFGVSVNKDLQKEVPSEQSLIIPSIDSSHICAGSSNTGTTKPNSEDHPKSIPIAKRKQAAISRELKRLQTDEGAQKIMSWHKKKKLKSLGKLLRSKLRNNRKLEQSQPEPPSKPPSEKLYSIDTISETKLVFKTGKINEKANNQSDKTVYVAGGSSSGSIASASEQEAVSKTRRGILSVSTSLDSEDGSPPNITEVTPLKVIKDNRSERCRSEELSPPPLIRPEDLFSEDYYVSMPVTSNYVQGLDSQPPVDVISGKSEDLTAFSKSEDRDSSFTQKTDTFGTGSNVVQGIGTSGLFSIEAGKLIQKRKRGRPLKRKRVRMGPASKIGRPPHVKIGSEGSKAVRKIAAQKMDPNYVHNAVSTPVEPRTFALRPKTTRSPIEIIARRQRLEEEAYELEEATREARKLKRKQAQFGKLGIAGGDLTSEQLSGICRPCSVVLVDFVKELHLNSVDSSDQYISDVSFDSDEKDFDEDEEDINADVNSLSVEKDYAKSYQHMSIANMNFSVKDMAQKRLSLTAQALHANSSRELSYRTPPTSPRLPGILPPSELNKTIPDLGNLKGKGFEGNFVDFIQSRDSGESVPQMSRQRLCPESKKQVIPGHDSSLHVVKSLASVTPVSSSGSQEVYSVQSPCQGMTTTTDIHSSQHGQALNQSCGSPLRTSESKIISGEKIQLSQSHSTTTKHTAEKSHSPGKLKVFPSKRDTDGGEKASFTRYLCTKCEFAATNKGTMESHIYRHIPGVNFKCGYCESEFTGLISALTHVKNSHTNKEPRVWISKDINEASLYTEEEITLSEPDISSGDQGLQQKGVSGPASGGSQTGDASVVQENQPVIISLVVSGDMPVQRTERFSSSPLLTQRRFACTHCSYSTNVMEDAQQHVHDLHSGSSLFTCYLCDKAFGCSKEDIVSHCESTHPFRPKSFKRLPDFYDQEIIRVGSGERSKSSEERGNIFDRMTTLFPNMGPGSEVLEDGQLSPQARFLRARDYLYIQEGWSKKTSAEADSTTIEDIETPFEDAADVDTTGSISISEYGTGQQSWTRSDGESIEMSTKDSDVATSSNSPCRQIQDDGGIEAKSNDADDTNGGSNILQCGDSGSKPASSDQCERVEQQKSGGSASSPSAGPIPASHTPDSNSCTLTQETISETTVGAVSALHSSDVVQSATSSSKMDGSQGVAHVSDMLNSNQSVLQNAADRIELNAQSLQAVERLESSAPQRSPDTQSPGEEFAANDTNERAKDGPLAKPTDKAVENGSSKKLRPGPSETDVEGEDDGETDILVIDLGDDVIDDVADDTSPCSTPDEAKIETSFSEEGRCEGDASVMNASTVTASSSATELPRVAEEKASETSMESVHVSESSVENSQDTAACTAEEDNIGIKILSVVSLRDTGTEGDPFSGDFQSVSEPDVSSPAPTLRRYSHGKRSNLSTTHKSPVSKRKSSTSSKELPEVDADVIAERNERMVCTYKCHKCSVHSPTLSAIVEHLKQHHNDVPLFSCPYCKSKKNSFYFEEKVHMHVIQHHPSNYAKNEVSLSEVAKSFVQVVALPSGKHSKGNLIEQDIYMCLQCESHVPDLDYGLHHLKCTHPELLKYACPICCVFLDSAQEVVKKHMKDVHGYISNDHVQLSVVMEGVYLNKVTSISLRGQYVNHSIPVSTKPSDGVVKAHMRPPTVETVATSIGSAGSIQSIADPVDNTALVASTSVNPFGLIPVPFGQASPFILAPVQPQMSSDGRHQEEQSPRSWEMSKQKTMFPFSSKASNTPQQPRVILPMPDMSSDAIALQRKNIDLGVLPFQMTGVTVKDILDVRQKTLGNFMTGPLSVSVSSPSSPPFLATNVSASTGHAATDSPSAGRMFSVSDRLDCPSRSGRSVSPHGSSTSSVTLGTTAPGTLSSSVKPVLRVPNVSSVLDLTSPSRCLSSSVDTGTSVNTLVNSPAPAATLSSRSPGKSFSGPALPFSIAALTAPVTTVSTLNTHVSSTLPKSRADREDPEAFKIFNLKPRTPLPQSPQPLASPSAHKTSPSVLPPASPRMSQPSSQAPVTVTMASSQLFPQQFRLQQFPQPQPANITTLPLGQGGLPLAQNLAMPIGTNFPLGQGGLTIPLSASQAQFLVNQNPIAPLLVTTNILSQLGMPGSVPQLPIVPGQTLSPATRQTISDIQPAPVNLSVPQQGRSSASKPLPESLRMAKSPMLTAARKTHLQPRIGPKRGRGRPRLNADPLMHQTQPLGSRPRNPAPMTAQPAIFPKHRVQQQQQLFSSSSVTSSSSSSSPRPAERQVTPKPQRQSTSHLCACPYCPKILKPWEVAQHIKVNHPGKEVKYNRVQ